MERSRARSHKEQAKLPAPGALLDVEGAARWLAVSRSKLFELMHEDDFPVIVITEKLIRFDPNSLYEWALKRQKTGRYVV
jgi:hypothetical protein